MPEHSTSSPLYHFESPWDSNNNSIWLASTLHISRNVEPFLFPEKLDPEQKEELRNLLTNIVISLEEVRQPKVLLSEQITPLEREFLFEHFLQTEGSQENERGSSFILDSSGKLLFSCNIKDLITIHYTDTESTLEESWEKLIAIENAIAQAIPFAYHERFGFLTAAYDTSGTGFVLSGMLHTPALIHQKALEPLLERLPEIVAVHSLHGDPNEFIADILILRNTYTIGVSEETIITTIRDTILHFVLAEKAARNEIKKSGYTELKDRVYRAIGLLKFSYSLEAKEALAAISLVKLGIELNWLTGMSLQEINRLLFECRRAHLILDLLAPNSEGKVIDQRAAFLRKAVASIFPVWEA